MLPSSEFVAPRHATAPKAQRPGIASVTVLLNKMPADSGTTVLVEVELVIRMLPHGTHHITLVTGERATSARTCNFWRD